MQAILAVITEVLKRLLAAMSVIGVR